MPSTHQDNGASMGGTLDKVSTQKNCNIILADSKGRLNSCTIKVLKLKSDATYKGINRDFLRNIFCSSVVTHFII
jgi:hypothetical protein